MCKGLYFHLVFLAQEAYWNLSSFLAHSVKLHLAYNYYDHMTKSIFLKFSFIPLDMQLQIT